MAGFIFWFLISAILYVYIGYAFLLLLVRLIKKKEIVSLKSYEPSVTVVIAAYNEKDFIPEKIKNLRGLDYPKEKLKFLWITDGSNDGSPELLAEYKDMQVAHENARNGKIGALNRGIQFVNSEIVVFCDANNLLVPQSIKEIVKFFADPEVGCVAGEKQILKKERDIAAGAGEGFYWNYESYLKKTESEVNSCVGAVGELFALRRELFETVEPDTILDDFLISLRIAEKGYKIKYAPKAIAIETGSASIEDELKRKIRIAAGSFQTIPRLPALLNPVKHGFFSIQYWSHKVLRWSLVPVAMIILPPLNIYLCFAFQNPIYNYILFLQSLFYIASFIGFLLRKKNLKIRILFAPYYLFIMNFALVLGFFKFLKGKQSVNWEKAQRQKI